MKYFIFVVCPSFHGATLLSCLLNNHSFISSLGDTIPKVEFLDNDAKCSCGETIRTCPFWVKVIEDICPNKKFRDGGPLPFYPILLKNERLNEYLAKIINLILCKTGLPLWRLFTRQCDEFMSSYAKFCALICSRQNTKYFVGGQKNMTQIPIVHSFLENDQKIKVIHLIRDPRAAYYSNVKRYKDISVKQYCKNWMSFHRKIDQLGVIIGKENVFNLRYEDLCEFPRVYIDKIQSFIGVPHEDLIIPSSMFREKHVIGNTMINTFDGTIKLDRKWQEAMPVDVQREILIATKDVSARYSYFLD